MKKLMLLKLLSFLPSHQLTAPHISGESAHQAHQALSPHAAFETCIRQYTGGGSGASVFVVELKDGHPILSQQQALTPGAHIVLKIGKGPFQERVEDDLNFFRTMQQQNPGLLSFFATLYETSIQNNTSTSSQTEEKTSYYYMENLGGTRLCDWINNTQGTPETCIMFFKQILEHFFDHTEWFNIPDPEAARDAELKDRILKRLQALLTHQDISGYLQNKTLPLKTGKSMTSLPNPKITIETFLNGTTKKDIWKRDALKLYTGTTLPSDTTTLNAMTVNGDVRLIDPGRICTGSPLVVFGKLLSPFSRFIQSVLGKHFELKESPDGLSFHLNHTQETREYNQKVFSQTVHVLDDIKSDSADHFRNNNPFFKIIIYALGCFQFGADMIYRTEKEQQLADLYFFTRFTDWVDTLLNTLYDTLSPTLPTLNQETCSQNANAIQEAVNTTLIKHPQPAIDYGFEKAS